MKVIFKKLRTPDAIRDAKILLKTMNKLRKYALVPKGVYKFRAFEEANRWMIKTMASTHVRLNLKT